MLEAVGCQVVAEDQEEPAEHGLVHPARRRRGGKGAPCNKGAAEIRGPLVFGVVITFIRIRFCADD